MAWKCRHLTRFFPLRLCCWGVAPPPFKNRRVLSYASIGVNYNYTNRNIFSEWLRVYDSSIFIRWSYVFGWVVGSLFADFPRESSAWSQEATETAKRHGWGSPSWPLASTQQATRKKKNLRRRRAVRSIAKETHHFNIDIYIYIFVFVLHYIHLWLTPPLVGIKRSQDKKNAHYTYE